MQGDANKYVLLETTTSRMTSRLFLGFYTVSVSCLLCPAKLIFTQ